MSMIRRIALVLLMAAMMPACSTLRDPNAVVTVKNQNSQAVITQADKRAIFMFESRETAYACPEPSPDVKADIESAVKALASASANLPQTVSADVKAELEANRKVITAALVQRSQGLQVLRDMLFQACLANLRQEMSPEAYTSFVAKTLPKLTTTLIAAEMVTKQDAGKVALAGPDLATFLNFLQLYQGP